MQVVYQPPRSSNDDVGMFTQAGLLTTTVQSTLMERERMHMNIHVNIHTQYTVYACYQLQGRIPLWCVLLGPFLLSVPKISKKTINFRIGQTGFLNLYGEFSGGN